MFGLVYESQTNNVEICTLIFRYKINAKDGEQAKASVYSLNDPFAEMFVF